MDRVLVGTSAQLRATFTTDGSADSADGSVTVTVTNAIGTAIATAASTTLVSTGVYGYTLSPITSPTLLTLTWSGTWDGVAQTQTTHAEVLGGRYCTLADIRALGPQFNDATQYSNAQLLAARDRAEVRFEELCGRSFVSRCRVETFTGDGRCHLRLARRHVSSVAQVTVDGTATTDYELESAQLMPKLYRSQGWGTADEPAVVRVVYVAGKTDAVPDDVRWAVLLLSGQYAQRQGVSDRAYGRAVDADGLSFTISSPGPGRVGIPEVDAIIADRRLPEFA